MKRETICVLLNAGAISLCANVAHSDTIRTKQLQEVSVKKSLAYNHSQISTASPFFYFSSDEIRSFGIDDVSDVLRMANSVTIKDYGGLGGMKTVSVRNLGAEHTGVVYDGVPVSNCQAGQIDISRFSTDNLSSVKMGIGSPLDLLSPASLEPFSGNLFMETENGLDSYLQASYGSFNTFKTSSRINLYKNENLSINGFLKYVHTDGDYPFTLTNGAYKTKEHRNNNKVNAVNTELNVSLKPFLNTKIYYYYSDRRLPGNITLYTDQANERLLEENFFLQNRYRQEFNEHFSLQGLLKYNHSWTKYFDGIESSNESVIMHTYKYRQDEVFASVGAKYQFNDFNISLVADEFWNTLKTNIPEYDRKSRNTTYVSLRTNYHNEHFTANANLVYTYLNENTSRTSLDPNLSVSYKPIKNKDFYIRSSWRKAFRLPTLNDMYYYRLGNHDLRPESTNETNIGITYSDKIGKVYLSFVTDYFLNFVDDMIVAIPTTFAWKMSNYGKVKSQGINISTEIEYHNCLLTLGYSYNDVRNRTDKSSSYYDVQIPYTAKHSGNASFLWKNKIVNVGYYMTFMGERYSSLMHDIRYQLEAYAEHSLTLSRLFKLKKITIDSAISCKNIFDQQYEIIQFYPMPGRQFEINIKLLINK